MNRLRRLLEVSKHRGIQVILDELSGLVESPVTYTITNGWDDNIHRLRSNDGNLGVSWHLVTLPGCCGVGVIHHTQIIFRLPNKKKRTKVFELVTEYQEARASQEGYGAVITTHRVAEKDYQQARIDRGYLEAARFRNPNSGSTVTVDVIEV